MSMAVSARRKQLVEDTFPHLDSLWQTALWLSSNNSMAESLVLKTMTRACREWHLTDGSISGKTRIFRNLAREFLGYGKRHDRVYPPAQFLSETYETLANNKDTSQLATNSAMNSRLQLLQAGVSDKSVKDTIAHLKPLSRLMVILLMRERFLYKEIAYIIDLEIESVKTILYRLHRLIPHLLTQQGSSTTAELDQWENEGGTFVAEIQGNRLCENSL